MVQLPLAPATGSGSTANYDEPHFISPHASLVASARFVSAVGPATSVDTFRPTFYACSRQSWTRSDCIVALDR